MPKTAIIIPGATGDLAARKLIPALSALFHKELLPPDTLVMGTGRSDYSTEEFRLKINAEEPFADRIHYHRGFAGLKAAVDSLGKWDSFLCFFALPPKAYSQTASALHGEGFRGNTRLVVEKPFGYDEQSARLLNEQLHHYYNEEQIFRMDHYLAKEAIQNLLAFRFANSLFEPLWNRESIEAIHINAQEQLGVGKRAAYFDQAGIIRDMVQNHLMQMLLLLMMDAPDSFQPESLRYQKSRLLAALVYEESVLGQYAGYREEPGVASDSNTPTWAQVRFAVKNRRWEGVPVYITTGKAQSRSGTEIAVTFKKRSAVELNADDGCCGPNRIIFAIQPAPGIIVDMMTKVPGEGMKLRSSRMNFCFYGNPDEPALPDAYERLLLDALRGDKTLFVSAEETEAAWRILSPLLASNDTQPFVYRRGETPPSLSGGEGPDFSRYALLCPIVSPQGK